VTTQSRLIARTHMNTPPLRVPPTASAPRHSSAVRAASVAPRLRPPDALGTVRLTPV
jgi:hypothetical protein